MAKRKRKKKADTVKRTPGKLSDAYRRLAETVMDAAGRIPESGIQPADDPEARSRSLTSAAARDAAAISGALALPSGPLGAATVLPDLVLIWKRQAKLVADIAAAHDKTPLLTRESMLYCLFEHIASEALADVAVRVGQRLLITEVSVRVLQRVAAAVARRVAPRLLKSSVARWLPVVGAVGVGAYAYRDTTQVGRTALKYFSKAKPPKGAGRRGSGSTGRATKKS